MGKSEDDEFSLSSTAETTSGSNSERRGFRFTKCFRPRCLLALLFGISVFLSALFWLPPFLKLSDPSDSDLDPRYRGHTIVARFTLWQPASFLNENHEQLALDIYYEIEAAHTKVSILSLDSSPGSNESHVVFGIDPESKHSSLSPAELSLIRASFESLVTEVTTLQLTSLFGKASHFDILKFPGGITVSPPQFTYPLQNVQISFNFTINNSIRQINDNFEDLRNQLMSGLHLSPNENLHIQLTNFRGSTVAPPATVQTSVVLAIGIPSAPRLKQLAHAIKDSPARNLGLNNRVFGKVKQVSLSSVLQHSLGGDGRSPAPAPSPLPHSHPHHHHYHHHHHHHHHHHRHHTHHHHHQTHEAHMPPCNSPSYSPVEPPARPMKGFPTPKRSAPPPLKSHQPYPIGAPAPHKSHHANPTLSHAPFRSYYADPPGCRCSSKRWHTGNSPKHSHNIVAFQPIISPHHSVGLPHRHANSPPPVGHQISPSSPLPNVIYARVPPPLGAKRDPEPPDKMPSIAVSPSANGARSLATNWALFAVLVALLLHQW